MKFSLVTLAAGAAAAVNNGTHGTGDKNGTIHTYTTVVTAYTTYCPVRLFAPHSFDSSVIEARDTTPRGRAGRH